MSLFTGKYAAVLLLSLLALDLSAQDKPLSFLLKGGLNLSYLDIGNDEVPSNRVKGGAHIGVSGKLSLKDHFFLQSGLAFSTKGAMIRGKAPLGFPENTVIPGREDPSLRSNQLYLQIPVQAGYEVSLASGKRIAMHAGPYFAQGIGGKTRLSGDILYGDYIDNNPLEEPTFGSRGLRRFDYGLGAGICMDLGEVLLGIDYEFGLKDIGPRTLTYVPYYNASYKNRNLALTVGFKF